MTNILSPLTILLSFSSFSVCQINFENIHQTNISQNESCHEVFSYKAVLKSYYNLINDRISRASITKDFETFVNNFYSENNENDLYEYTYQFGLENNLVIDSLVLYHNNHASFEQNTKSSSPDADYILSPTTYLFTPESEFKRQPFYSQNIFDYHGLQRGDIIYEADTIFGEIGHSAVITAISKPGYYGSYVQTIEVANRVSYGFLDDFRMVDYKVTVFRVSNCNYSDIYDVINFMVGQLDKKFHFHNYVQTSSNSENWYCSELVYAAYFSIGVDLNQYPVGVLRTTIQPYTNAFLPINIKESIQTYHVLEPSYTYLEITLYQTLFNGSKYRITSHCDSAIVVYYNRKYCFLDDALNWTNLSHISHFTLLPNASSIVTISINWTANTVAACFYSHSHLQVISAAKKSNNVINNYYNVKFLENIPVF